MTADPQEGGKARGPGTPIRIRRLGTQRPEDEVLDELTPRKRLEVLHELSTRMWELTGRPVPTYDRSETPVRVVRRT